jgi:DNA-binding SARP family transcriptional activator
VLGKMERVGVQVLGPLTARLGSHQVTPTAAKQRQILGLLALNAGQLVTTSTLAEELWGDNPPKSCATTVQTYILQLRNRLTSAGPAGPDPRSILTTQPNGYRMESSLCHTDADEFGRLTRAGRAASERGDHRAASEMLTQALTLWRGTALADVPVGRVLELEVISLEENRLAALERRIEADLALHRHADLLGELRILTARNPMNESFSGFLMTALYRSGHAARALEEFRRVSGALRRELGIEPSGKLQQLHLAMLSRHPALDPI